MSLARRLPALFQNLLGSRYLVLSSTLTFLAIISIAFYMVYVNSRVMHDQVNDGFNQQQLILARQAASQIDAILQDLEIEVKSLELQQFHATDGTSGQTMRAMMERTRNKGVIELGLIDSSGRVIQSYSSHGKEVHPGRFKERCPISTTGQIYLGPLQVEHSKNGQVMVTSVFCAPIHFGNRKRGMVFARLDVSRLVTTVTSGIRSGRTGYAWVIDQSGIFLYHPEKDFIGKNAFTARAERQPYISFAQINRIMKELMLSGQEGVGLYESGWHRGMKGQITKLIAFTPVKSAALAPGNLWSVAVAAPLSEVSEALHSVYIRHFVAETALIAVMSMIGLLAFIFQNRISKSLKARVEKTESDLHETERIYQRVVEQATDLIYSIDPEMRIVLCNRHTIEVFSHLMVPGPESAEFAHRTDPYRPDIYVGRNLQDLLLPEDVAFMRNQMERVMESQSAISFEQTLTVNDRKVHLSTNLIPIRNEKDEIYEFLGMSRNITEKMEMDQRIYNTEKLASIGTLAAGVAHEINNPLAIILGFTDLIMERFPAGSPEYEDLQLIEYNANHAKKVVENLLGFARVTEGLEDTVDVGQSVSTVLRIIQNTLMTKKITLYSSIPGNLPRVRGDAREFQQVIFNLINNSIAVMEKTGGTLGVHAEADGEWVYVNVIDSGAGIPDKIKPRIFDPFFTTKKVGEGTGLGLSLCYGIVTKYNGKITFSSSSAEDNPAEPTGTQFTVAMPVQNPE